jgi:hypothetical protein
VTPEEAIVAQLERRIGSLPLGARLRIMLDQPIVDRTTHRLRPGPHIAGYVERLGPDHVKIRLMPTEAGRTAAALVEDQLLDVVLSRDSPPSVRLADRDFQHERSQELIAWAARPNLRQEV